jgi:hypothetical protein
MEIDVWMSADDVRRAYREVQKQVLPGHNRPVSDRSVALVNFVMRHQPESWPNLLRLWNTEHPDRPYANYRALRHAYQRASRSLLEPGYHYTILGLS